MRALLEKLKRSDEEEAVLSAAADGWNGAMSSLSKCAAAVDRSIKTMQNAVKMAKKHGVESQGTENDIGELEELSAKLKKGSKTHDNNELYKAFK